MSESRFNWAVAVLLLLVCCIAYVNTLDGDWVWDDVSSVLLHRHVQQPSQFFQLFREDQHAFGRGQGNFYRPLVAASFMLDYYVSGGPSPDEYDTRALPEVSPFLFHVTNMLWHYLAALLFFLLLHQLGAPRFVKMAAPLVFVAHPLHTEAVAYISGRADMMSAVGIFAALCFAVTAIRLERPLLGVAGAALCFVGGLLSKESTLIYPVLLLFVFVYLVTSAPVDKDAKANVDHPRLWRLLPLISSFVILVGYLVLRTTVLRFAEGDAMAAAPLSQRLFETIQSLGVYAQLLFMPVGLHMERTLDNVSSAYALVGALFLVLLIATAALSWKHGAAHSKRIALGLMWLMAAWLPISGIFPLNAPLAEHWMYVPMAGFWWALAEIAWRVCQSSARRQQVAAAIILATCVVFVVMTAHRNRDWGSNERLFRATLRQNPNTVRVHYNLAVTYDNLMQNYAGARRHYERYLELRAAERAADMDQAIFTGDDIEVRLSLGRVLLESGEYVEAVNVLAPLRQLADIDAWRPTAAMASFQAGQALLALGDMAQAHVFFDTAIQMHPELTGEVEGIMSGMPFYDGY